MIYSLRRYQSLVWALLLLILVIAGAGILQLRVTADNRVFYSPDDSLFQTLLEFESEFRSNTKIAFVLTCENPIVECSEIATAIRELASMLELLDGVQRVDSLANYPFLRSNDDEIEVSNYLDHVCPKECDLNKVASLRREFLIGRYASNDLRSFAVVATMDLKVGVPGVVERVNRAAIELLDKVKAAYDIDVRFVGTVPLMQAFVDAANRDLAGILSLSVLVTLLLLGFAYGSAKIAITLVGLGTATVAITLGIAGWYGLVLNTATSTIPLILFSIIVATSTHLYMHVVRTMGETPRLEVYKAVDAALQSQLIPIVLTSATTIACLLSLVTVSSPPIREIGIWTSVGVSVGTVLMFTVVPLFLIRISDIKGSRWQDFLQRKLNLYARYIERNNSFSIVLLVVFLGSSASILNVEIDDDFVRYFDSGNEFRQDTEFVAERLFGPNNLEVVVGSGVLGGVYEPQFIEHLERLTGSIRDHQFVKSAVSMADVVGEINKHFGDGRAWTKLDRKTIAQYFFAYELSLEHGQSLGDLIDFDRERARISVLADDVTSTDIKQLEKWIYEIGRLNGGPYEIVVTGESIPISHLTQKNIWSVIASILMTFVFTSALLGILFRNLRLGLAVFVTTIFPVVCGFGILGLFVDSIGLSTTVIIAVCMGVVIDDAIHIVYRHVDARQRLGLDAREAAAYSVHRVGTSVVTSTVALVAGFGILFFSDFSLNSTFGICSALILVCALVIDMFMLPKMLIWSADKV